LGDVFLHLLPEAYDKAESHYDHLALGAWVLLGVLAFVVVEMMMSHSERAKRQKDGIKVSDMVFLSMKQRRTRVFPCNPIALR